MCSDAEEAKSQAKEMQEEHRLAERQLSETKTRQNPSQDQHWAPENHSALTLRQLETGWELQKYQSLLTVKIWRTGFSAWNALWCGSIEGFLKCYTWETYTHPISYIPVLLGRKTLSCRVLGGGQGSSGFPAQPPAWTMHSGSRLPIILPSQFFMFPRMEILPPFWAACSRAWLWLQFFLILSQNFL